jgi:serine/threonine protein kinase
MLIDFGLSKHHMSGWPPYHEGQYGTYQPPEMHPDSVCNAYHVDIWCFGNTIKDLIERVSFFLTLDLTFLDLILFQQRRHAEKIAFLSPWLDKMMAVEPTERPTASQALIDLRKIIASLPDTGLRKPIRPKEDYTLGEMHRAVIAILRGEGDEEILFARLRGAEPTRPPLSFWDGSLEDRKILIKRVVTFLLNIGRPGGFLLWLAPTRPSQPSKK